MFTIFLPLSQCWWICRIIYLNPLKQRQLKTQQSQGDHFKLETELSFKFSKNLFIQGNIYIYIYIYIYIHIYISVSLNPRRKGAHICLESTIKHEKCLMPGMFKIISCLRFVELRIFFFIKAPELVLSFPFPNFTDKGR